MNIRDINIIYETFSSSNQIFIFIFLYLIFLKISIEYDLSKNIHKYIHVFYFFN